MPGRDHTGPDGAPDPRKVIGKPHPDRARQFMPFMALRGFHDLVHSREITVEERHELTDDEAVELNRVLGALELGSVIAVRHFDEGGYRETRGAVTLVDTTARRLRIIDTLIDFDDIWTIIP